MQFDLVEVFLVEVAAGLKDHHASARLSEPCRDHTATSTGTDHDHVGAECKAVREGVGIIDISGFGKFSVTGPNSKDWLDKIFACRLPAPGKMALAPMLNERGKLIGDFTIACHSDEG
ncbi:MAG: hypothetical protein ACPHCN_00650, partial [Mycobacterium sp.]